MVTLIDKEALFRTFGVSNFHALHDVVSQMAPSLVEYHLSDLCDYSNISGTHSEFYFSRKNIEETIDINEYSLYLDYNNEIFLEIMISHEDRETTGSLLEVI